MHYRLAFFPIARIALLCVFTTLLSACGSREIRRVNPPQVSIQKLELQSGRHIVLDLRVQNHSDVPMQYGLLTLDLQLASRDATHIEIDSALDVPPHSAEIVQHRFQPDDEIAAAFERALTTGITYRLRGEMQSREPRRTDPVEFDGRLNPVPGKPGEFR
jgi:LEA14-like dessication related protein